MKSKVTWKFLVDEISILVVKSPFWRAPLYFSTLFPGPKKRPSPLQPVLVALVLGLSHQIPLRAEVLVQPRLPVHGGTGCWETMGNHGKMLKNVGQMLENGKMLGKLWGKMLENMGKPWENVRKH